MSDDPSSVGDRELLAMCAGRSPGAWEEFIHRYNRLIYYAMHRTMATRSYAPTAEETEDLLNDLLVHLIKNNCKKLTQYRGDQGATVATWLRTVTVRFVIDYLRKKARESETVDIDSHSYLAETASDSPETPEEVYESKEAQRMFSLAVSALDEKDRYFMELYYGQGLAPEKVADVLGISVKTVYSRVNRLKTKISDEMKKAGRKQEG
jgi:RNA polymerase sigma factor (sigma-70 family)